MSTVFIEGSIIGHASPKWKNPGKKDHLELNKKLSIDRAAEVEIFVQELLSREFQNHGIHIEFALECTNERNFNSVVLPSLGVGESVTIEEAGGDTNANDPKMRRVDINIVATNQIEGEAGASVLIEIPEECEDNASDEWAVRMSLTGGAGHAGVGGAFALGQIKNLKTDQKAQGFFAGGGIGVGLQSPGADPGWSDWSKFRTDQEITFQHLNNTFARLTTAGAGFLIGYSFAYLSFPIYGANSIPVGGFNLGSVGADASSNLGTWKFAGTPPGANCIPAHMIPSEQMIPYSYEVQDNLSHSVFFDTGSSRISDQELSRLENFITGIGSTIHA